MHVMVSSNCLYAVLPSSPDFWGMLTALNSATFNPTPLPSAGRWDLYQAITRNGGYRAVAEELDRNHSRPLPKELTTAQVRAQHMLHGDLGFPQGVE